MKVTHKLKANPRYGKANSIITIQLNEIELDDLVGYLRDSQVKSDLLEVMEEVENNFLEAMGRKLEEED